MQLDCPPVFTRRIKRDKKPVDGHSARITKCGVCGIQWSFKTCSVKRKIGSWPFITAL